MTPQEQNMISSLFQRLQGAEATPRDREAADLIDRLTRQQPTAPYLLVQTVLVQEQALNGAQARLTDLERQLAATQAELQQARQAQQPQQPRSGSSFLGGAGVLGASAPRWGGGSVPSSVPPTGGGYPQGPAGYPQGPAGYPQGPAPGPWGAPAQAPGFGGGGGGFLRTAMTTAAGVAGGALLFEGIEHMMNPGGGAFGSTAGGFLPSSSQQATPVVDQTINNYYGNGNTDPTDSIDIDQSSDAGGFDGGGSYYDDV